MVTEIFLWTLVWLPVICVNGQDTWARWCGKHYQQGSPYDIPSGQFEYPKFSQQPLFNFQCWPSQIPYASSNSDAEFIIDAQITHDIGVPLTTLREKLRVSITLDEKEIAVQDGIPLGSTSVEIPFRPADLGEPRRQPYIVTCTAHFSDGTTYFSSASVKYLPPNPYGGSMTGLDLYTGSMIVYKQQSSSWEKIIPFGFYTDFDGYLVPNRTHVLSTVKNLGHNMVHPIPTFGSIPDLLAVIELMNDLDLWLMYDMRWSYKNLSAVQEEVERIRGFPNLLLWYTADEPDGHGDPLDSTVQAQQVIEGEHADGWHPISLVLGCDNHYYKEYTAGANIILEDAYPVDFQWPRYSSVYETFCDKNYGCCGCDNCVGSFTDISTRLAKFAHRNYILSRTRSTPLWAVPQAFGGGQWWPRQPTGSEWLSMTILALNYGAMGIVPWDHNARTSEDLKAASGVFGSALRDVLTEYLTHKYAGRMVLKVGKGRGAPVHVGIWRGPDDGGNKRRTWLVMVANTEYHQAEWEFKLVNGGHLDIRYSELIFRDSEQTTLELQGGNVVRGTADSVGSGAWILSA